MKRYFSIAALLGLAFGLAAQSAMATGSFYANQTAGTTKYSFVSATQSFPSSDGAGSVSIDYQLPNGLTNVATGKQWVMLYMHATAADGSAASPTTNTNIGVFGEIVFSTTTQGNYTARFEQGGVTPSNGPVTLTGSANLTSGVNDSNWHNVFMSCDATGFCTLYLDGVQKATGTINSGAVTDCPTGSSSGTACGFGMKFSVASPATATQDAPRFDNFKINGVLQDNFDAATAGQAMSGVGGYNPSWRTNDSVSTQNGTGWIQDSPQSTDPVPVTLSSFSAE